MLDYKLIQALAMVVEEGGFERAARRLHLTQSAISQRVKLLEDQMGQILLVRTTPPRATPAGRQVLRHYRQVACLEGDLLDMVSPRDEHTQDVLPIGINGDSLASWFLPAVGPFLKKHAILLDIRSDDQEQTPRLLQAGEVIGCISTMDSPLQGCRMAYLGCMPYRLLATPTFATHWFGPRHRLTVDAVNRAPFLIFNRRDELHIPFFTKLLGELPDQITNHYLPSSSRFVEFIAAGHAYGLVPDQQSERYLIDGTLIDLSPNLQAPVHLHWHCWNLKSRLLDTFTKHLVAAANELLA